MEGAEEHDVDSSAGTPSNVNGSVDGAAQDSDLHFLSPAAVHPHLSAAIQGSESMQGPERPTLDSQLNSDEAEPHLDSPSALSPPRPQNHQAHSLSESQAHSASTAAGRRDVPQDGAIRFCVWWDKQVENVALPANSSLSCLQDAVLSAPDVPVGHKHFIYRGCLLDGHRTLAESNLHEGSMVHMVLNEQQDQGRAVRIKSAASNSVRTIMCTADVKVEDVKEELSFFPEESKPEDCRLVFAGRLLEDPYSLRQYNIQKPCVMFAVAPEVNTRHIKTFVSDVEPVEDSFSVPVDQAIRINFKHPVQDESHFWGHILGSPDINTVTKKEFLVHCTQESEPTVGTLEYDEIERTVTFVPEKPLREAAHYRIEINKYKPAKPYAYFFSDEQSQGTQDSAVGGIMHTKSPEKVQGTLVWNFFTAGYVPLRVTSVYPRPYSRVSASSTAIILGFSGPLDPASSFQEWLLVKDHELKPPLYDAATFSLVYEFVSPPDPESVCRVRLFAESVRGSRGETLLPLQQDDLIKASCFRWKFHVAPESAYEGQNAAASGLSSVLKRWKAGKINVVVRGRRRGQDVMKPKDRLQSMAAATQAGLDPAIAAAAAGLSDKFFYRPSTLSPAELTGGERREVQDEDAELWQGPKSARKFVLADEGVASPHDDTAAAGDSDTNGGSNGLEKDIIPKFTLPLESSANPLYELLQGAKQFKGWW